MMANQKYPPLFRQVAVEAALGTQIGDAFAAHWRGVRYFTALAFALTAVLGGLVATVQYSPVRRVPCYTDLRSGVARLSAPVDGQIAELAVAEGSRVRKGDILAVVSTDKLREGGDSWHSALAQKLQSERGVLEREIDAATEEAAANRQMIARRIGGLRMEHSTLRADVRSADQLLNSLRSQADQFSSLVTQGYVSKLQLAQKRDDVKLQESRVAVSHAALSRIERDIATSEAELSIIAAKLGGVIASRRRAIGELERLSLQSDADAKQVIRAPTDGTVSTALIVKGQSVELGQMLFTVAPAGEPLIVRLLVPARVAAVVKLGMEVRIILQAYPREKFGSFVAHIESMSDTPALPRDLTQVLPMSEAAFLAIASLPPELHGPDGHALWSKPGMIGEALVPVERRTILEWLLEPILRALNGDGRHVAAASASARGD